MGRLKQDAFEAEEDRRQVARLGDIANDGLDIFCWCNRCNHYDTVASAMLVSKLGPAMPVPEIGACMKCSNCQSKDIATRPNWPSPGRITRHL